MNSPRIPPAPTPVSPRLLEELAQVLSSQSIRKGDFTLASGAKSHYYCDTKATVLSPRGARLCGEGLLQLIRPYHPEAVGGLAMGAAYLATAVALASDSPDGGGPVYGFTVRAATKEHGIRNRIDCSWYPGGPLVAPGRKVALIDDVVTSAGSILQAIDAMQEAGCEIVAVAAVVDRQAGGSERIRERGLRFGALLVADEHGDLHHGTAIH
jgi:orotate phosphoribosyltransferase